MPDGPERTKILQRMSELVTIYAPWNLHAYRYENVLVQPWLVGYKYNAFNRHPWPYYDVDSKRRKSASQIAPRLSWPRRSPSPRSPFPCRPRARRSGPTRRRRCA